MTSRIDIETFYNFPIPGQASTWQKYWSICYWCWRIEGRGHVRDKRYRLRSRQWTCFQNQKYGRIGFHSRGHSQPTLPIAKIFHNMVAQSYQTAERKEVLMIVTGLLVNKSLPSLIDVMNGAILCSLWVRNPINSLMEAAGIYIFYIQYIVFSCMVLCCYWNTYSILI